MTKLTTTLTLSAIASILVIGGFAAATPNAFSTYGGWHDDDDDDCDDWHHGYYNDDDDCGNNEPKDPCDCEKPDTLKFIFSTPSSEIDSEFRIEIYKKINYIGNEDKKLTSIADVTNAGDYQIESSSFGKDKLNSNTVFAVYKIVEDADDILVSSMEIHTSCSQDLYIGQTVNDNGYSLEITDGLKDGETSISASNPLTCGDEPEPEKTGTIVVRNAITVDNGGQAMQEDFSYKVTDESGMDFDLIRDSLDPSIHAAEVPKGTYTLSQTIASTITESYTEVLITGDKKCPATTNESFKIKKDKTVSCTIYNDDNGDGSSGEPGAGVVFRPTSVTITPGMISNFVLPDDEGNVMIDASGDSIIIIDPEFQGLDAQNLIVIFTIIDPSDSGNPIQCFSEGIVDAGGSNGFRIACAEALEASQYILNYALIKTIVLAVTP